MEKREKRILKSWQGAQFPAHLAKYSACSASSTNDKGLRQVGKAFEASNLLKHKPGGVRNEQCAPRSPKL